MGRSHTLLPALVCAASVAAQWTYEVRPAQIRPQGEDYAPALRDSALVFCALREGDQAVRIQQAESEKPLADLFTVPYATSSTRQAASMGPSINTILNDGPASFTADGRSICFTRNLDTPSGLKDLKRARGGIGLFFAHVEGDGWTTPEPFRFNDPEHRIMHPSLSADGQRLIFAADLPGGQGGMDLYECVREDGSWSIPVNLGPAINGPANEVFPFLHTSGTLYFSSDREGGLGRLDILSAGPDVKGWAHPVALPEPVNSPANDLGYTSFATDVSGAFSSDRNGADEIFLFMRTVPRFADCRPQEANNFCYQFSEPIDPAVQGLPLRYSWDMGDGTRIMGDVAEHCYDRPGIYIVQRDLVDTTSNTVFFTVAKHQLIIDEVHQPYITALDSARTDRPVLLDATHTYLPEWVIEDVRWRFPDDRETKGLRAEHRFDQAGEQLVQLDILGTERATGRLMSRCVTKPIAVIQRFVDTEDTPVLASYQDATGVTHEFAYQALPFDQFQLAVKEGEDVRFSVELFASKDRRSLDDPMFTEIRKHYPVIERFDPARGVYTYSVGEAKTLAEVYDLYQKVKQLTFLDAEVMALNVDKVVDLSMLGLVAAEDLNNTVVRASTVYFATNSASFDKAFEPSLAQITELLNKHPRVTLVIEAHTDDRGRDAYNRELSDKRAQALLEHFTRQGIAAERLVPLGHGEARPIASNVSEAGRAKNRRVEFRLNVPQEEQARISK
ncbi:MAG TPA: OmpA family protein [Flavobacteriales bacterium]|nr:OmpA family protein [Flavobacteriales bacterium]HMR28820.1 OmpA family protein [Flavobacteriales bacterium]